MSAFSRLAIPRRKKTFREKLLPEGDRLPFWSTLDLDEKLPIVPSPKGSYTLCTTSIGEPKYVNKQKYDFDLTDPFCHARPLEYSALHDPYLKNHFRQTTIKQRLVKNGLLTHNDKVVCSLSEFNKFREYLRYRQATEVTLQRHREASARRAGLRMRDAPKSDRPLRQGAFNSCLIEEIRKKETDALIRREKKRTEAETKYQQKLIEEWKDRKERQQKYIEHMKELKKTEKERRHKIMREKSQKK